MKMNESYEMTFTLKDADMIKLAEIFGYTNINNCPYFEIQDKYGNSAKYYRENPPSAQPEIIRCKDCMYWDFSGYCVDFMTQDENGFCSWAKRRTDEQFNQQSGSN